MKQNKYSIIEIKKYLKKKGFIVSKQNKKYLKENSWNVLSRTLLSSLIIISIFFISPAIINFKNETMFPSKNFENNSNDNFKKTLKSQATKLEDNLDQDFLFEDILKFDERPIDTVRLTAATIEELFKATNYNL